MTSEQSCIKSTGNAVDMSTFLKWGKEEGIGYKTEEVNDKKVVNFVWCKVCARYKEAILRNVKGSRKLLHCLS